MYMYIYIYICTDSSNLSFLSLLPYEVARRQELRSKSDLVLLCSCSVTVLSNRAQGLSLVFTVFVILPHPGLLHSLYGQLRYMQKLPNSIGCWCWNVETSEVSQLKIICYPQLWKLFTSCNGPFAAIAVTWYMLEGKLPDWDIQNKENSNLSRWSRFVLDAPVGSLPSSMYHVTASCKRPIKINYTQHFSLLVLF